MIGATQKTNHPDIRVCFYAGRKRLPHQYCCLLDSRSMASTTRHCPAYHHQHYYLPYLEAQT